MAQSHKTWTVFLRTQSARFSDPSPVILRNYLAQWSANLPPECLQRKKKKRWSWHCASYCVYFSLERPCFNYFIFFTAVLQIWVPRQTCIVLQRSCIFPRSLELWQPTNFFLLQTVRSNIVMGEEKIKSRKWSVYPFVARYFIFICKNLHKSTELFLF